MREGTRLSTFSLASYIAQRATNERGDAAAFSRQSSYSGTATDHAWLAVNG